MNFGDRPPAPRERSPESLNEEDRLIVADQLGREPRGACRTAWRCPCGRPGVVQTAPALPDGTPFPTTYYLTCPRATKAISTLEGSGLMASMAERLSADPTLAARYEEAHRLYIRDRERLGERLRLSVPQITGVSAGGMPTRVKCLHALAAHSLAAGPGVNPLGDEVLDAVGEFWEVPCLDGTLGERTVDGIRTADEIRTADGGRTVDGGRDEDGTWKRVRSEEGTCQRLNVPDAAARTAAAHAENRRAVTRTTGAGWEAGSRQQRTSQRVAVIDCGTNTVRLYVAEGDASGATRELAREVRYVRLGEGVDAAGVFAPAALNRLFSALDEFAEITKHIGVDKVRFIATSATRDVGNREELFDGVRARLGVGVDVVSGDEEAALSFLGVMSGEADALAPKVGVGLAQRGTACEPKDSSGPRGQTSVSSVHRGSAGGEWRGSESAELRGNESTELRGSSGLEDGESSGPRSRCASTQAGPTLVMDLGGGSTEFILGESSGAILAARSTDMGSVRVRERYLHGDPPTREEIGMAITFIDEQLDSLGIDLGASRSWVGVAGTCTSLSAMRLGLTTYDRKAVHNSTLTEEQIGVLTEELLGSSVSDVGAMYPVLNPMRAEVICAGALICSRVALRVNVPLIVRETDILDGAALRLLLE